MTLKKGKVLVLGYGNPGRLDDGLGPALADEIDKKQIPGVTVDSDYQLTVEDAMAVAEHEKVIFVDASIQGEEPFFFKEIEPAADLSFSTHSVQPKTVLGLAHTLFGADTKGFILGVRGYEFNEFGQQISQKAQKNLNAALLFIEDQLHPD